MSKVLLNMWFIFAHEPNQRFKPTKNACGVFCRLNLGVRPHHMRSHALLAFALLSACSDPAQMVPAEPRTAPADEIRKIARAPGFSVSGVAFRGDSLFIATNVGLIETQGRIVKKLYRWHDEYNVISGPWPDTARSAVWAHRVGDNHFLRLGKEGWQSINAPRPPNGYTRGDMLAGFSTFTDNDYFRLVGAGGVWRWNGMWEREPLPPAAERFRGVVRAGRAGSRFVYVVGQGMCLFPPCTYAVYWLDGDTWSKPFDIRTDDVEELVTTNDAAFLRERNGELLQLGQWSAARMETPGKCEAIARTADGKLLASFRGAGIFVRADDWVKLLDDPYTDAEGEHFAYLAENHGTIALGTARVSHYSQGADSERTYSGTNAVWISEGETLARIRFDAGSD